VKRLSSFRNFIDKEVFDSLFEGERMNEELSIVLLTPLLTPADLEQHSTRP